MKYLIYTSKATKQIYPQDIHSILNSAINFNIQNNICGMLVFKQGHFFQILEGEKNTIWELFEKRIKQDNRHQSVELVMFEKTKKKIFSDWSMGICNPEFASKECYALKEFFIANYFYERLPNITSLPACLLHTFVGMKYRFQHPH